MKKKYQPQLFQSRKEFNYDLCLWPKRTFFFFFFQNNRINLKPNKRKIWIHRKNKQISIFFCFEIVCFLSKNDKNYYRRKINSNERKYLKKKSPKKKLLFHDKVSTNVGKMREFLLPLATSESLCCTQYISTSTEATEIFDDSRFRLFPKNTLVAHSSIFFFLPLSRIQSE